MDARLWCLLLIVLGLIQKPQPELTPMSNASGDTPRNATDSGPIPQYAIEKCRGHWHVTSGGEVLIGSYDTPEEAQRVADQNNAGDHSEPRGFSNEEIIGMARQFIAPPASGDDEELKDAITNLETECALLYSEDTVGRTREQYDAQKQAVADAGKRVESLFGRIREERDRARRMVDKCYNCGHEFAAHDLKSGSCFNGGVGEDATGYEPDEITRLRKNLSWHGCLTGDCPHDTQAECNVSLADAYRELAKEPQ